MAQLFEHVDYLSREIGARPAGTEEEQQAALYIAEQFQKDTGFHTEIEEFTSSSNIEGANAILGIIVIVASVLAMLFNMLAIPAFLLILVAAAIYILEAFDHPFVSKALSRGASQNVVAKYQPNVESDSSARPRSRKIVLVAHYDSGKVTPSLVRRLNTTNIPFGLICVGGMAAAAFLMLLRIFFGSAGGIGIIILNVLTVISLIIVALPVVKSLMYRLAPYNEGANNNATGTAALLEIAHHISQGSISEADIAQLSEEIAMHGEQAIVDSGLVPEGVEIDYEDLQANAYGGVTDMDKFEEFNEEERLLAAKAAIAALTGRPVETHLYSVGADEGYDGYGETSLPADDMRPGGMYADEYAFDSATYSVPDMPATPDVSESEETAGFQNAPSWFVSAQKNAKKSPEPEVKVQRSRYSSALDDAERGIEEREAQRLEEERAAREAELKAIEEAQRERAALAEAQALEAAKKSAPEESEAQAEGVEAPTLTEADEPVVSESDEQAEPAEAAVEETPAKQDEAASDAEGQETTDSAETVANPTVEAVPEVDLGSTIAFDPRLFNIDAEVAAEEANAEVAAEEAAAEQAQIEAAPAAINPVDLPTIESDETSDDLYNDNPSRSGMFRKLRTDVPSLSGVIRMQEAGLDTSQTVRTGSKPRPVVPAIDQPAPQQEAIDYDMEMTVSDEFGRGPQPADQNVAGEHAAHGPRQVEMPSSRVDGSFGGYRHGKKDTLQETPQEWLGVDEDFNAREVGKQRGGWESFRNESGTAPSTDWEGGAFSRVRLGHVSTLSGEDTDSDVPDELVETTEDRILNDEIEQIIHFRNPSFNTEVWFVAIGSDTELHDGAKAFVEEHRAELRGSMIIELESLGAGVLSVASEEGRFRTTKASSRIKRFTRGATMATGIAPDSVSLTGTDSIASVLQREGFQSMHLFGAEDGAIALKGSADDVIENVDEMILEENVGFVLELLKHV